jgi:hypothetical protein
MDVMLSEADLEVRTVWALFRQELGELPAASLEHTIRNANTALTRAVYTYELMHRIQEARQAQSRHAKIVQAAAIRT